MSERTPAVLFVCLGNICRSPLAEAAFRAEAERVGLEVEVDSAGTGDWHVGDPPDPRAQATAMVAGIDISDYRARQVVEDDFFRYDHIFAMDAKNLANLNAMAPTGATAEVTLLLNEVKGREGTNIRDPYLDRENIFAYTWDVVAEAAKALAERLAR
ncbi:low molecular weight protein-tyrosine-phosphatase [Tsuneonella sp. HG094]